MRLLFLSSEFPPGPGGIGTHAYQLAHHLSQMGWEVLVVTPQSYSSKDEIEAFNVSQPFKIVSLSSMRGAPLKAVYRWRVVSRWIKEWKPDVLLASGDRDVYLAAQLAKRHKFPWVAVEHGRIPPRWERGLKRWSFQQATTVVCVSEYTSERLRELGVRPRDLRLIPNGADVKRFEILSEHDSANFRAELGFNGQPILLTVGSVTDRKGQDVVIRALPRVLEKVPDTHYIAAGLPIKQREFTKLAHDLGVDDRVHFLGQVDNRTLLGLLNCCDVFVMTSRHTADEFEGYGIAVVEAALCGKPAVVSTDSGLAEAIVDGETGLGVPENDAVATAERIISLLTDEEQRQRMGQAARVRALREQSWEHRASEYDAVLRVAAAKHSIPELVGEIGGQKSTAGKLVIVSHTPHYRKGRAYVGWGPTVREVDSLACLFDEVVHIAPLNSGQVPDSAIGYVSSRVRLRSVPEAGGTGLLAKLKILRSVPAYLIAVLSEIRNADVVHVRCPANISLITLILLAVMRPRKCWVKYAGNWEPEGREPLSYTLQRWWLNHGFSSGVVTVNGKWPNQPKHVHSFSNPCLTDQELADGKASTIDKQLSAPIRLLFVGSLVSTKGVGRALEILADLKKEGLSATIDFVGDGPERAKFERQTFSLEVSHLVRFHGWLPRSELVPLYIRSHFMVFPTESEGWPKVLSEGIAYGVVPVTSKVSSIPQYLKRFGVGRVFGPDDVQGFSGAIIWYCAHPDEWKRESMNGMKAAELFTYTNYLNQLRELLGLSFPDKPEFAEYKASRAPITSL